MDKAIEGINERVRRQVIPPSDNTIFNRDRGINRVWRQNATWQGELRTDKAHRVLTFAFPVSTKSPRDGRTVHSAFVSTQIREERRPKSQNGQGQMENQPGY